MIIRVFKITFGAILLVFSVWALLLPPFFPSSSYSVVNARKINVEAPSNGTVTVLGVQPRTEIVKGDRIASIALDQRDVEQTLHELEFAETRLASQIRVAEDRLDSLRTSLQGREDIYLERQARTVAGLRIEQAGVEDSIEILQKELLILREDERRIKRLLDSGIITKARWSEVNRSTVEAESRLQSAVNERNRIAKDLEMAKSGFLQGERGNSDSPTPEISIASIRYEIRTVEAELSDLRLKHSETLRLIDNSKRYLSASRERSVQSPVTGLVWYCQAVEGQTISTGQSLIQIADRKSVFVEGYFHRYYEESISHGDYAFIRLTGEPEKLRGRVVDIQVQEHGSSDMNVINSVAPSSSMLRVIIKVDSVELTPEMVGRLGKVVLTSDDPGLVNQSLVWLSLRLRNS